MACALLYTLLLLVVAALISAANPKVKIGGALSSCGDSADITIKISSALQWWSSYINNHGGIIINDTQHDVEIITYNDAFDESLRPILYERLIEVDEVDLLLSPFGNSFVSAAIIAQKYQIPIMDIGDFGYYTKTPLPNGTFGGWAFSALPNSLNLIAPCYSLLKAAGVKTISSAWTEGVSVSAFDLISLLTATQQGIIVKQPTPTIQDDLSNLDTVVDTMKQQGADAFSGTMFGDSQNVALLTALYKANYFPKAMVLFVGPTFESFRTLAGWLAGSIVVPAGWAPTLNYKDPVFGSSQGFYDAFKQALNRTPDITDIFALHAVTAFKVALETADSKDPSLVQQALLALNNESWFGTLNFSQPGLNQQTSAGYYCFQLDRTGSQIEPVFTLSDLVYPAVVDVPPGFVPSHSHKTRNLGLGLGLGLGVPVFALLVGSVMYLMIVRYQVVFIPKSENQGEW